MGARRWRFSVAIALTCLLVLASAAGAGIPPGYYARVDASSPAKLRATVHAIIKAGHVKIPYSAPTTDVWNVLERADQDPADSSRIRDVYRNASYPKFGAGNNRYQREHAWPKSFGFPHNEAANFCYTDCHMLFLADGGYNAARSNNVYDDCAAPTETYPVEGTGCVDKRQDGFPEGRWEVWEGRRGDVARALLYMDVRYEGEGAEPDLVLTDDINRIEASNTGRNLDVAYMGILSTLLRWNEQDPVSPAERRRNDVVYSYQRNRNPFVDHPEWVRVIFGGVGADSTRALAPAQVRDRH